MQGRSTVCWLVATAAIRLASCGSGDGSAGEGCGTGCGADLVCLDDVCVPDPGALADADGDGVRDREDRCAETPAGDKVDREGCSLAQATITWSEGPYGIGIRETAGDFTVNTLDGPWNFRESWTGAESYLFLLKYDANDYARAYWNSDVKLLLEETPLNTHIILLSGDDPPGDMEAMKARIDATLSTIAHAKAASWIRHIHYVVDPVTALDGTLGQFFEAHRVLHFGIDRFQRWREVGMLYDFNNGRYPIRFLGNESTYFDYERRLAWFMNALDATEVIVSNGDHHDGGWDSGNSSRFEAQFPPAPEMAGFDSMAVHVFTACPDHRQGLDAGCNEWDYAHHLMLCDADDETNCVELVRYVTPYGREGEWLTDVSPLLPLVKDGGRRVLRYVGANGYDLFLKVLLWNAGKPSRPVEVRYLWGDAPDAQPWDTSYNLSHDPVTFTVEDSSAVHVELFASITGHGFGATSDNCAEFCNHQHEFSLNGTRFLREHPELDTVAGQRYGCYDRVGEGVVPNQFGSWPFGRAGWCPGQDVKPLVQDVSAAVVSGENAISYRALFRNEPYDPTIADPEAYLPELRVASWLVFYAPAD